MSVSLENFVHTQNPASNPLTDDWNQTTAGENDLVKDKQFACGDVVSGKVTSMQGNAAELLLSDGQKILALLNEDVQIPIGEQVLFLVKGMRENGIELAPLFENTAKKSMVTRALENAGLPDSESNIVMVQKMMEKGMSVQKEALLSMKKSIAQFPDAKVEDVVTLKNMKIPVSAENLSQLSMYKNQQHEIIKPVFEILDKIPEVFDTLMEKGEIDKGIKLYSDFILLLGEAVLEKENSSAHTYMPVNSEMSVKSEMPVNPDAVGTDVLNTPAGENGSEISREMKKILLAMGVDEKKAENIVSNKESTGEIFSIIERQIQKYSNQEIVGFNTEKLAGIFKNSVFREFIQKIGRELSEMSPEDVKDFDNIDKLYENIRKRAGKILELLGENEEFPITERAQNLKNNLDFMNQLNQMYQYVQIPLKFSQSHTTGELYVYGNGKKLSLKDGNVSALLHLSMEHLGIVDIHVEMDQKKQVKTNFYLEDEAVLEFLYDHINLLNERLEKRGYAPVTNVCMRDEDTKTPMETILENKKNAPVFYSRQSFDTRI